jgi:hypothetical protein
LGKRIQRGENFFAGMPNFRPGSLSPCGNKKDSLSSTYQNMATLGRGDEEEAIAVKLMGARTAQNKAVQSLLSGLTRCLDWQYADFTNFPDIAFLRKCKG